MRYLLLMIYTILVGCSYQKTLSKTTPKPALIKTLTSLQQTLQIAKQEVFKALRKIKKRYPIAPI
ncbi:hypothetical protein HHE06_14750 [Helicobacter heilmannii]|uniref:Uncharacterized protein n=1 Tax=Helicobacter heilmannii TaxID=35817 RepID=A0A0K2XZT1_HELHE|nr:hypothetical protein [Helicobacter heilmannii]CCM10997.1 hypothetical protein BN341_17600 [Helicobacter heilmannii ASB1.4]CCM73697.1 hypothetical protein BN341_17620 [Helicobacter heilmannii ASB1.4]CCM73699.1 hypothetical protein BN341_17660 [Helicobacter heilmannii ASB1.4]CRF51587.1 hypothetical protein HHE06_14750 [Helicobacter heilmannii]CRI33617.1 hypothetical protein HHE01_08210 [Helicobacter heilmannii]